MAKRKAQPKSARPNQGSSGTERLTGKQRIFVAYYLGEAKFNATEAARMAGYAFPKTLGPRLVGKSWIKAAIDAKFDEVGLTVNEILAGLSDHATASVEDFIVLTTNEDGRTSYRVDLMQAKKRGRLRCVKKIKATEFGLELELYDAQAALDKLAKVRRLYQEGSENRLILSYAEDVRADCDDASSARGPEEDSE